MRIREAIPDDIRHIQVVRNSVKENVLSDPAQVSDADCLEYITQRGKGWVCEIENEIIAFAIADLQDNNIWALFVHPAYEKNGIGKALHNRMLDWYFDQNKTDVWLSTSPGTRAENFYRQSGWKETGIHAKGEIRFEMSGHEWETLRLMS
jgi:GNAT superfamily N-acetyltransferase